LGRLSDAEKAFSEIYRNNVWGKGSGIGSEPSATADYIAMLQAFLREHDIKTVVDFGCGDWQFSKLIDWSGVRYQGFDIVPSVIEANQREHAAANISFHVAHPGAQLPTADLVVCKDVLQHLPVAEVRRHRRSTHTS
jgi:2-polyprenyl-3-methyl-5-hydroxy-6-metoxy-1,4-benzoquinol methylase